MKTKSFYEVPAAAVVEFKSEGIVCDSQQQAPNTAERYGYGVADEI